MFQDLLKAVRRLFLAVTLMCPVFPLWCAQKLTPAGEARVAWEYAGDRVPWWTGGFLLPIEKNGMDMPVIHAIDDSGMETAPIMFSMPGAHAVRIDAVARGSDGTWALSGRAFDREGKGGGFISWVSPDRFDKAGKPMGDYIPRLSLPEIDDLGIAQGKLASNKDHVGWYVNNAHEYVELAFEGDRVSYRVIYPGIAPHGDVDMLVTGLALMDNGDAWISAQSNKLGDFLYRLDRSSRSWIPMAVPTGPDGKPVVEGPFILGGDGKRLALYGGIDRVVFVKPGN